MFSRQQYFCTAVANFPAVCYVQFTVLNSASTVDQVSTEVSIENCIHNACDEIMKLWFLWGAAHARLTTML